MVIIEGISSSITHIAMMVLFNILYKKKDVPKLYFYLAFAISIVIMIGVSVLQTPVFNVIYTLIAINTLNKLFYKCRSNYCVLYNTLAVVFLLVIDMMSVIILSFSIGVDIDTLLDTPNLIIAGQIINCMLIFVSLKSFTLFIKRTTYFTVKKQELLFYLLLTGFQIYLLHFITSNTDLELLDYKFLLLLIIFLFIDVHIAFLIHQISKVSQIEYELKLAKEQLHMQFAVYSELLEKYNLSRSVKHDVNEHIKALEGLIDRKCIESARQYTKLLNQDLDKLTPDFKCTNQILSVIINNKLSKAKTMKIDLILDIEDIQIGFISDLDVTSIFASILDNAFSLAEGAMQKSLIKLTVHKINNFLVVNIFNKGEIRDTVDDCNIISEEQKSIGLLNAKRVVERYDGVFNICIENNMFTIKITIPIPSNLIS